MRILHTADWHLGDRLGRLDRTADLRAALERVAEYCRTEQVDVLAVAGDLFSDKVRHQDDLRDTLRHLGDTFRPFLQDGGTILAVTGNHDRELPFQTLKYSLALADPAEYQPGSLVRPGRFYLATAPTFYRIADRNDVEVQFVLMPYPTPAHYLDGSGHAGATREQVHSKLKAAYHERLDRIMADPRYRADAQTVLIAHIHALGAKIRTMYRLTEADDVLFERMPAGFAYIGLGHIHIAQAVDGSDHIRYSGSIERLDAGERDVDKSVAVVEIGAAGRTGPVQVLPLPSTPFYDVEITDPETQIPSLTERYPDAARALVKYRLEWKPGEHNRDELVRQIESVFPRCYDSNFVEVGKAAEATRHASLPDTPMTHEQTVLHFLEKELTDDPDRDEILQMARELVSKA